ncbi:MAG TPA: peptide chain release factor N(5)-glutamine methyltransferase [Terriglobales bacterium]|nr:peptide chain release factor N(5)-glutamine methyltransferase [Terriglobales bacterium]
MPTLQQEIARAAAALEQAGKDSPHLQAEVLLAWVLGQPRSYLFAHPEETLAAQLEARYRSLIARRAAGEPLQHLTGEQEFFGRRFKVSPAALIPRAETELVVQAALERVAAEAPAQVLDIGTGSGCIAITLALERPKAHVRASEVSAAALEVARVNAENWATQVEFAEGDLLAGFEGPFDLIVSNPPYLSERDFEEAAAEVRAHDPRPALVAGRVGTEVYARLIPEARKALQPQGWLVLELGYASAEPVRAMLKHGWEVVETRRDLQLWERVLVARRTEIASSSHTALKWL